MTYKNSQEYKAISEYYGTRTAKRSGVPLINHIHEGCQILEWRNQNEIVQRAFCIHPLVQIDYTLLTYDFSNFNNISVIMLAMEYRNMANSYLPKDVPHENIKTSPFEPVKEMLIADKIQNRKDFEIYHKGTHQNSDNLSYYFINWLTVLGISEEEYEMYCEKLNAG